jgi:HD superfamily phosphohydrolase
MNSLSKLSKKFYDPLYDVITIRSSEQKQLTTGRKYFAEAGERPDEDEVIENIIYDILDTYEMNRLNFLKQAGLSYLFLPSATHTRFSHSLGTYYLGEQASQRSWFQDKGKVVSLRTWLMGKGLLDDFLVALLLHDVGHFPFSHVLENNNYMYQHTVGAEYDSQIYFTHEAVACELIDPEDAEYHFYAKFREQISDKFGETVNEEKFLSKKLDKYETVDKNVINYLISGNEKYFQKIDVQQQKAVKALRNLTSGIIDLDRMDHYRRDSLFMGVKLSNFSVLSLLDDLVLTYNGVKLKEDGVTHALALLQSKENLVEGVFEDDTNVAYEVMLNSAIERYIANNIGFDVTSEKIVQMLYDIVFLTDDELLFLLEKEGDRSIKRLIFDIKNRTPFKPLHKSPFPCVNVELQTRGRILALREKIASDYFPGDDDKGSALLFRIPKSFRRKKKFDEWLDLDQLQDEHGRQLGKVSRIAEVDYFKKKTVDKPCYFNVFYGVTLEDKNKEIGERIHDCVQNGKY